MGNLPSDAVKAGDGHNVAFFVADSPILRAGARDENVSPTCHSRPDHATDDEPRPLNGIRHVHDTTEGGGGSHRAGEARDGFHNTRGRGYAGAHPRRSKGGVRSISGTDYDGVGGAIDDHLVTPVTPLLRKGTHI